MDFFFIQIQKNKILYEMIEINLAIPFLSKEREFNEINPLMDDTV